MIISPPFLPARAATQNDTAWLDTAFGQPLPLRETNAPAGSYPLGIGLAWHNGLHVQGAANADNHTPVYAIADGEVIHVEPPRRSNNDPADAQNVNPFPGGAVWTDNGLVILRHETEIGANGDQPTTLTYYSAYMHLNQIGRITPAGHQTARVLQLRDRVYRKDEIGKAGQIYGHAGQIHLEICLNQENLQQLIGRPPARVDPANIPAPTADGRIDAVFGTIWFYLPATTPTRTIAPTSHLRSPAQTSLQQAVWVRMHYEAGSTRFEAYDNTGRLLGQRPETNGEYDLYRTASSRHESLAAIDQTHSSPSGWYELLRFGRNLGRGPNPADKDPLPANAAHWRQINLNGQDIWVDLNTAGSYKFSDADFLPIQGWNFIDDDSNPNDQRCDSNRLKTLIADPDPNTANRLETATLERRLGDQAVMRTLRRMICRFPSEWERGTMPTRYGFVRELPAFRDAPGAWEDFQAHLNTLTFTGLPADYLAAEWRVHPKEFVGWMRQCGWLSLREMAQMLPRRSLAAGGISWEISTRRLQNGVTNRTGVRTMPAGLHLAINQGFRKYLLSTSYQRQAHFCGQVFQETGALAFNTETGNERYFRTMYEVITPAEAGEDYDDRPNGIAWRLGLVYRTVNGQRVLKTREEYVRDRPGQVQAKAQGLGNTQQGDGPRFRGRGLIQLTGRANYSGYGTWRGNNYTVDPNPLLLAGDAFISTDVSFKYWVSKNYRGLNINRHADAGTDGAATEQVTRAVNGGTTHIENRREYFGYVLGVLNDALIVPDTPTLQRQMED